MKKLINVKTDAFYFGDVLQVNFAYNMCHKEVEKVKKFIALVESDPPTTTKAVDTTENTLQCSNIDLEITKSPAAAISVSEPSTVVKIIESPGAPVSVKIVCAC